MRSLSMSNLFGGSSPDHSPPDSHSKAQAETPRRSKTDTVNSAIRTFGASRNLNHALGMKDAGPFVPPPAIPYNLTERFEASLQGYEQLYTAGVFAERRTESSVPSGTLQQGRTALTNLMEEKESPVQASPTRHSKSSLNSHLTIGVPEYTYGKQIVATSHRYNLADSDIEVEEDTAGRHTGFGSDDDCCFWEHGSSITLAANDSTRPGSATSEQSLPPPSFPQRLSSLLPLPNLESSDANAPPLPSSVTKEMSGSCPTLTAHAPLATHQRPLKDAHKYLNTTASSLNKSESLPMLFPSSSVLPVAKASVQSQIARRYADKYIEANGAADEDILSLSQEVASSSPPLITIQAPSPVKSIKSRKQACSSTNQDQFGTPSAQRPRRDDTTGLPIFLPGVGDENMADFQETLMRF